MLNIFQRNASCDVNVIKIVFSGSGTDRIAPLRKSEIFID